ncbi:lipid-binding protein [Solitalea longa]|uniref:Lipid-binding protein n=1 Tax=Solitalea longa TaxID=2079460 RepID=A0A2S4ZWT1_9SPHI|nr:YceI family protein [Solitalea longa]POY34821.1 lipid-binding protein [Solitalea longa]
MKKILLLSLSVIAFISFAFISAKKDEVTYKVDATQTNIVWFGKKITGMHSGSLQLSEGYVTMKNGKLAGGTFEFDMKSITDNDLKDPNYNAKLVNDLKSDNFFAVDKFPTAKFVITKAKSLGKNQYAVTGNLTLKGITKEIQFPAFVSPSDNGGAVAIITNKFKVNRIQFDIKYRSASIFSDIGDKAIDDDFELEITQMIARRQ